ncbi:MAG: RecX family transcriptional regulator [Clostridia bacterium]|nr:RecX family transcriptional regulator [Clostridia bacterium]
MIKLEYVRGASSKGYVRLGVNTDEGKASYTVSEATYSSIGAPRISDDLTRDSLDIIKNADMEYRARIYALRILGYADNSERRLAEKLCRRGIDRDIAVCIAREMVSLGYINTDRQLDSLVRCEVNIRFSGPAKIIPKLKARGYDAKDVSAAISRLQERGEIDFELARLRLIESKHVDPEDRESVKKILYRNGHNVC